VHVMMLLTIMQLHGIGTRLSTLVFSYFLSVSDWILIVNKGRSFKKQLQEAFKMKLRHGGLLAQFTTQFDSDIIEKWTAAVEAWDLDPTKPNPHEETEKGVFGL
jgi:hypothetical protein